MSNHNFESRKYFTQLFQVIHSSLGKHRLVAQGNYFYCKNQENQFRSSRERFRGEVIVDTMPCYYGHGIWPLDVNTKYVPNRDVEICLKMQ